MQEVEVNYELDYDPLYEVPYVVGKVIDACRDDDTGNWIYTIEKSGKSKQYVTVEEQFLRPL